jgi:C1A family cysteine protease
LWESFKSEFNKEYASEDEEAYRFNVFVENLRLIDSRNEVDTASHGITKFMDMSPSEFRETHLNYIPDPNRERVYDETIEPLPEGANTLIDWTGKYTTPVKDQGYCGSCWAFSATEQIESDYMRTSGKTQILSAQQVTSCTSYLFAGGCNGGSTEKAFDYAKGGLETDSDYPYTSGKAGITGSCNADSSKYVVKATGYTTVSSSASGESKMASYVSATGPLSVCVDAETWSSYTGGIMSVCGTSVDHCVQAVGLDQSGGYWKVRNSWGTSWGESGFIRLKYGSNTCAIASDANYASTSAV